MRKFRLAGAGLTGAGWIGLKRSFQLCVSLGVLMLSAPTAAVAQLNDTDANFLNDFYSFLRSQDEVAYQIAAMFGDESNVWLAQGVCLDFNRGISPADGYDLFVSTARSQMQGLTQQEYDQVAFSVDLYGGAMMNLGSAYYCPQYQPQVEAALRAR